MQHLLQEVHLDEMSAGARDIVLDVVGEFRGRNSSGPEEETYRFYTGLLGSFFKIRKFFLMRSLTLKLKG